MTRTRNFYYLKQPDGSLTPTDDPLAWARQFEDVALRTVAQDHVKMGSQRVYVSTIFLGMDHNYFDDGPPILWETMAFLEDETLQDSAPAGCTPIPRTWGNDVGQWRWRSEEAAVTFHARLCKTLREASLAPAKDGEDAVEALRLFLNICDDELMEGLR